jgi:hypothetical protein
MPEEYRHTQSFRGATFEDADLRGATFRNCAFDDVRIVGCLMRGIRISGWVPEGSPIMVEDVDVSDYVRDELDRRNPERVAVRGARTADERRTVWRTLERLWAETITRAERLPESLRYQRVDDEWSFVETLRHLVFATDVWLGRMVLGEQAPFHPLGMPTTDCPDAAAAQMGLDLAARPTYEQVLEVFRGRQESVRRVLAGLHDAELDEPRTAAPVPHGDEETRSVRDCLRVLLDELCEHRRFAVRDLAVLEDR